MTSKRYRFDWVTVYCNSITGVFIPFSPWMAAVDVGALRIAFEVRGLVGNAQVRAAYQTANDMRSPDTETGLGGTTSADGFQDPTGVTDVSTAFAGKEWFRLGFVVNNSSGTNFGGARVTGSANLIPRSG